MHKVLVNRLGGLSLPRKSVVRLTDRPDMTLDVYRGRKTTIQSSRREMCTSSVSNVIYHKFSLGAAFYTLNGKNVNVMLELEIELNATG